MRMLDGGSVVKGVNPACFGTMSEEDNKEEVKSEQSGGDIIPEHQQVVGVQHQRTQSMDDLFEQILNMPQAFHHEKSPWDLSTQNPNPNERMMFPRSYGGGDISLDNNFHLSYMQALQQQQLGGMIPLNHHLTPQPWRAPYCPPPLHQPRPPTGQRLQPHEEPRPSAPTTVFFKSFDGVRPSVPSTTQGVPFQGYEASVSHQSQPPQPATSGGQPPCPTTTAPARPRVRARRGQATDPHSIAERQRRERIAERMKALQELVPTCNKTDKGAMLDEIIDYVKFLQLQVKVLSMSRIGGAEAVAPLVAEMSSEVSNGMSNRSTTVSSTDESMVLTEQQVARLMEHDTGAAMQYLQSKGMCLMPLSLAATLTSTSRSLQHNHHGHSMHAMMVRSPPNSNTNSDNNPGENKNNNTEEGSAIVSASALTANSVKGEDTIRHRGSGQ